MARFVDRLLPDPGYLSFPLRVGARGPDAVGRADHIRQNIEQVLMTSAGERVFRPDFGAGVRALVFEPLGAGLAELTRKRLYASLSGVLEGEVDPQTLEVTVSAGDDRLHIVISYELTTIGRREVHEFTVPGGIGG